MDLSRLTKEELDARAQIHEDLEATLAEMADWDKAYKVRCRERQRQREVAAIDRAKKIDEKTQRL